MEQANVERDRVMGIIDVMAASDWAKTHPEYWSALNELRWKVADPDYGTVPQPVDEPVTVCACGRWMDGRHYPYCPAAIPDSGDHARAERLYRTDRIGGDL